MARQTLPLHERVVRKALTVIHERGIGELSIRDIARRLNVSHQAPYKLFPTRDHLVAEIASRCFRAFAGFLEAREAAIDPTADLRALGMRYLRYAADFPLEYQLMFATPLPSGDEYAELNRDARLAYDILRACVFREATSRGAAPGADRIDADALFVWTTMHGLAGAQRTNVLDALSLPDDVLAGAAELTCDRIAVALRSGVR